MLSCELMPAPGPDHFPQHTAARQHYRALTTGFKVHRGHMDSYSPALSAEPMMGASLSRWSNWWETAPWAENIYKSSLGAINVVCAAMLAQGVRVSGDFRSRRDPQLASANAGVPGVRGPLIRRRCLSDPQDHSLLLQLRASGGRLLQAVPGYSDADAGHPGQMKHPTAAVNLSPK